MSTKLFKDGDNMAIQTDEREENDFIRSFCHILSNIIEDGIFDHDWYFQLEYWLPQFVDICCKYRGYKNSVFAKTVLLTTSSGYDYADGALVAECTDRNEVIVDTGWKIDSSPGEER